MGRLTGRVAFVTGAARGQVTATALPDGMQEPADVAATVAFLACDESRFMTGTMLQIGAGNQLM
jgi:(+)-trans-carveol dehydrogenase